MNAARRPSLPPSVAPLAAAAMVGMAMLAAAMPAVAIPDSATAAVPAAVPAAAATSPAAPRTRSDGQAMPNPLASVGRDSIRAFVERPLFEPSRRPPAAPPPPIELPPPPRVEAPPMLRLIGVVEGDGSLAAIVRRSDTGRTETLHTGDRIGAWSVEVLPGLLRVASGDRAIDYALFRSAVPAGLPPLGPAGGEPR